MGDAMPGRFANPFVEICVETVAGARAAVAGGADQIEVCGALAIGGLTPSPGLVDAVMALARPAGVAVRAMVRPRGGGFDYDEGELAVATADGRALLDQGVDGLVFGATRDGRLDRAAIAAWRDAVGVSTFTLHRAIDTTRDPLAAVDDAIALGADQILSSGGATSAAAGAALLGAMVGRAADRCRVVAGAGVRADNVPLLVAAGLRGIHASARVQPAEVVTDDRFGFGIAPQPADAAIVRDLRGSLLGALELAPPRPQGPLS